MSLPLFAEGKTKIYRVSQVEGFHKDDMTAGDGARHEIVPGKGEACNTINSNVFAMLNMNKVRTTFLHQTGARTFEALASTMLPYEIVVRLEPAGSWSKRNPGMKVDGRFETPVVEFYLKTSGRQFGGIQLPSDDPLITRHDESGLWVYPANKPVTPDGEIFIPAEAIYGKGQAPHDFARMAQVALQVATVLDGALTAQQCRLVDFKIEMDDEYRVSDVLTPDEWRAFNKRGEPISKQPFRDGATIEEMQRIYEEAVQVSQMFPRHRAAWM